MGNRLREDQRVDHPEH
jgi:glucose dehydrogenase